MKKYAAGILLVVLLAASLGACFSRVRPPLVELAGVRFGGIGLRGATLIAELSIDNPNNFTIDTDSITFELEASSSSDADNWTRVTHGTHAQQIRIGQKRRSEVDIPIEFTYSGLTGPVRSIMDKGTFNYRVRGKVFVREPLRRTVPFSQRGNLSLVGAR